MHYIYIKYRMGNSSSDSTMGKGKAKKGKKENAGKSEVMDETDPIVILEKKIKQLESEKDMDREVLLHLKNQNKEMLLQIDQLEMEQYTSRKTHEAEIQ